MMKEQDEQNSTMVRLDGVSRFFDSSDGERMIALDAMSIDIRRNEFVALVGPSGCGKSTLLRIMAGLIKPSAGNVKIAGQTLKEPRENTGIVFQAATLLPWANVLDNILFPVRVAGKPVTPALETTAHDLIRIAGLQGFEKRSPRELSGGMQQRVALCRALLNEPDLLLMDEPFGALDALTREEMTLELLRIWAARPKTVVFVTHSISEAVLLADRVVVMSARPGRIADVIDITLPRPRAFAMSGIPAFTEASERIREQIFKRTGASIHG